MYDKTANLNPKMNSRIFINCQQFILFCFVPFNSVCRKSLKETKPTIFLKYMSSNGKRTWTHDSLAALIATEAVFCGILSKVKHRIF